MSRQIVVKMMFGSHLYGTATEKSDKDFKGIYIPDLQEILLKGPLSHQSDSTKENERAKNTAEDVDTEFFSLGRFVKLAIEGETVALDMLHANDQSLLESNWIWRELQAHKHRFYSKSMKAFIGYVLRQTAKYGIKGSRLSAMEEVLELLICYGAEQDGQYWSLSNIWERLPINEYCTKEVRKGSNGSDQNFYVVCGKMYLDNSKCGYVYDSIKKMYDGYGHRAQQAKENAGIDWKAVSHALRACYQLRDIYVRGGFVYPLEHAQELLAVKLGQLDYLTQVAPKLEALVTEIDELSKASNYPEKVDVEWWDQWLLRTYGTYYNIKA